jgi:N-acetylmuramoyl-L-alanine amidase
VKVINPNYAIIRILASLLILTLLVGIPVTVYRQRTAQTVPAGIILEETPVSGNTTAGYTIAFEGRSRAPDEMTVPELALANHYLNEALIPLSVSEPVLYHPDSLQVTAGSFKPIRHEHNYFYDIHTFYIENARWRWRQVLVNNGPLRAAVFYGQTLTLYLRQSYFAEVLPSGVIQLTDPKDLYDTIIVIDPGHGGNDVGALAEPDIFEKDFDMDIVRRLTRLFNNPGVLLLPTRTEDIFISLEDRYRLANQMGDYFISVHNNADDVSKNSAGTVTFYRDHPGDTPITSGELAQIVQTELVNRLGTRDRSAVPTEEYRLVNHSTIPTVITEIMFMSNPGELERLLNPGVRQQAAEALRDAIMRLPSARGRQ